MPSARAKSTARSRRGTRHTAINRPSYTFDQEALSLTVDTGIHVNCGSPDMIDQLGRRAPGRDITLRINLGFGHGHRQRTNTGGDHSKHGIWHEQLPGVLALVARHGLKVTGLHMHIGSGTDLEHLSRVCGAIERRARQIGASISTISAGGGLPITYRPDDPNSGSWVLSERSSHPTQGPRFPRRRQTSSCTSRPSRRR